MSVNGFSRPMDAAGTVKDWLRRGSLGIVSGEGRSVIFVGVWVERGILICFLMRWLALVVKRR